MSRRAVAVVAAIVVLVAAIVVAGNTKADAANNRYPICIQNDAGSYMNYYVGRAAADWNTDGMYVVKRSDCTGRQAIEIRVYNAWWGRNGMLGKASKYYRSDGRPWFCKVYVNRSYKQDYYRKYQRTVAHEIGHCLQHKSDGGRHFSGSTIFNPYRYSVWITYRDEWYIERRWATYTGYGRS